MPPSSAIERQRPLSPPPSSSATQGGHAADAAHSQQQQVLAHHLRFSRAGCIVAAVLVAMGSGLDHFTYPERFEEFMRLRGLAVLAILGVWALLSTPFGARFARPVSLLWLMIPQVMIAWMIHVTEGAHSTYFAGLLLALYAVGTVLPMTLQEGVFFGAATLLLYALACAPIAGSPSSAEGIGASFFTQALFILMSAITATACAWLNEKSRARMQALKDTVSRKNAELQIINHTLSQIKGQLVEREKMVAIGRLSAGLLQELNKPVHHSLMAINMGLGMSAVRADKMLTESLQDAREGMERIHNIVSDLKTFAEQAPSHEKPQPFALEPAVRSAIRLTSLDLKGIPVSVEIPGGTQVVGDEPALIGVLINLLSNAAHAVKTAKRPSPSVILRVEQRGPCVQIAVRDNGQGLPKDMLNQVFDPLFTTRGIGSGLGLGLTISQAVVQRHGSTLTVKSEPGAWTEFRFELAVP